MTLAQPSVGREFLPEGSFKTASPTSAGDLRCRNSKWGARRLVSDAVGQPDVEKQSCSQWVRPSRMAPPALTLMTQTGRARATSWSATMFGAARPPPANR